MGNSSGGDTWNQHQRTINVPCTSPRMREATLHQRGHSINGEAMSENELRQHIEGARTETGCPNSGFSIGNIG